MRGAVGLVALGTVLLAGCGWSPPPSDVTIVVDGARYTVSSRVKCTRFPGGWLLIYAQPSTYDASKRIRILLATEHRLVVSAAGFRLPETAGFNDDSREMVATKVDDTYTVSGRMPPEDGRLEWRQFQIEVTCSSYATPSPKANTV